MAQVIDPVVVDQGGQALIGVQASPEGLPREGLAGNGIRNPDKRTSGGLPPVAEDWDKVTARARAVTEAIDVHLDVERTVQGNGLGPLTLCPVQKQELATDMGYLARG